ncbi:hypothetical protein NEDG_02238 [Nematocida displodere]|uniref:RING-type domain-containing protein n=1 Tax=Nematocida displodere TaxID=1805483 RepID=A0A177EKL4_9MICR|nr:hypothetical protein NEDG_02238 [Nematocida displodere]
MLVMEPVYYLGKLRINILTCNIIYLLAVGMLLRCAEDIGLHTDHIVSPYTEDTINFFSQSNTQETPNALETVQILGKAHILTKQSNPAHIVLENYTLKSIPENLVQGIEFSILKILSTARITHKRFKSAVLNKILGALGTICTETLTIYGLKIDDVNRGNNAISRLGRSVWEKVRSVRSGQSARSVWSVLSVRAGPSMAVESTPILALSDSCSCVLNIKTFRIFGSTVLAIKWLLERVDLSQSRITLSITGGLELDNLEILDQFNAAAIERLKLCGFLRLDSLEGKLFREGPLPRVLIISTIYTLSLKAPEQIVRNIVANHWEVMKISNQVWGVLMQPSVQPKHITADLLMLYLPHNNSLSEIAHTLRPPMGDNTATVKVLMIDFYFPCDILTRPNIMSDLEWISRHFRGMYMLIVDPGYGLWQLKEFARNNQVVIQTNPALTSIKIVGIECLFVPNKKQPVLCFSLEAWDLCIQGRLVDELAQTQADLSQLSPLNQELLMSHSGAEGASEPLCPICMASLDELAKADPNTEIYILDHPTHRLCKACLVGVISSREGVDSFKCPICRGELAYPLHKNKIEKNAQGLFELRTGGSGGPLGVLSFPNNNFWEVSTRF